jgi:predicted DNA-binding transcriptional regulator AlpA
MATAPHIAVPVDPAVGASDLHRLAKLHAELAAVYARLAETGGDQLASLRATRLSGPVATDLMTAADLADVLRIDQRTLRTMRNAGQVPAAIQIGSRPRWRRADVDAWLAERGAQ